MGWEISLQVLPGHVFRHRLPQRRGHRTPPGRDGRCHPACPWFCQLVGSEMRGRVKPLTGSCPDGSPAFPDPRPTLEFGVGFPWELEARPRREDSFTYAASHPEPSVDLETS